VTFRGGREWLLLLRRRQEWLDNSRPTCFDRRHQTMKRSRHKSATVSVNPEEIEWSAIRAQGAGGQNVNKVSTAVHARYDIRASSLPLEVKTRLLQRADQRVTNDGVLVIKAQRYRSQDRNREDALVRLEKFVADAATVPEQRRPTRPSKSSQRRRIDSKVKRGQTKAGRRKITTE
jgi:ribosome-associated protein